MDTNAPAISVVILTYNQSRLLARAIHSVLDQAEQDLELIVVDDASTDGTVAAVREFSDSRVRYVRLPENSGGPAAPMSEGVVAARAPLVGFLDHDDAAEPAWLGHLKEVFATPDVGLAWSRFVIRNADGDVTTMAFRNPFADNLGAPLLPTFLRWTPGTSGLMVRKEVFESVGMFDPAAGAVADLDFTIRFAVAGKWSVKVVDEGLVNYYVHGGNLSTRPDPKLADSLSHILAKSEAAFRGYPRELSHYYYQLSILTFGHDREESDRFLKRAVDLEPSRLKYRAYGLLRSIGGRKIWSQLTSARAAWSARQRKIIFDKEFKDAPV